MCGTLTCGIAGDSRARLSRGAVRWALAGLVVHHLSVASHPYGDRCVTVIVDLMLTKDRSGSSRFLDMVPGRSKQVFKIWVAARPHTWRESIEVVAMDGFTGFKSAAAEELPEATAVMDPFRVVRLAGDVLDECRRRIQQELYSRGGRATDPLLQDPAHNPACFTPRQQHQFLDLFNGDEHVVLEVTWNAYQNIIKRLPCTQHTRRQDTTVAHSCAAGLRCPTYAPARL